MRPRSDNEERQLLVKEQVGGTSIRKVCKRNAKTTCVWETSRDELKKPV